MPICFFFSFFNPPGSVDPRSILLFVFIVLFLGLYVAKVCFNIWMGYSPPAYDEFSNIEEPVPIKEENLTVSMEYPVYVLGVFSA